MTKNDNEEERDWYLLLLFTIGIIILSPIIIIFALIILVPWLRARFVIRPRLLRRVRKEWLPKNRFILFVYSDNQLWKEYAKKNIIPKIASHALMLNWSERKDWIHSDSLEAQLFKNFYWGREYIWRNKIRMGGQGYNHLAIVFKPWDRPNIITFWPAFKDYEFGKHETMRQREKELYSYLD